MKFGIILLNWNGSNHTLDCVNSMLKSSFKDFFLLIVDNSSESSDFMNLNFNLSLKFNLVIIKEEYINNYKDDLATFDNFNIYLIKNKLNYGFAKGNNIGINFFLSFDVDHVLLLNNDTLVSPTSLKILHDFALENPMYSALTPAICYSPPNDDIIWNCGGKITWYGNRKYFYAGFNSSILENLESFQITFVTGCALFFRPLDTGLLTEQFFFGEEDFEFSLRLLKAEQKIACVVDSVIYHKVGRSLEKKVNINLNALFVHYSSRLINLRNYYNSFFLVFISSINVAYGFYLLSFKFNYGFFKSILFWFKLIKYSKSKSKITIEDFNNIMSFKF
jgi:GT2 family glycosyltransferase